MESGSDEPPGSRPSRSSRQARVGILANPNRAAPPAPRRPPLIGRWVHLRSSRRPRMADDGALRDGAVPDECAAGGAAPPVAAAIRTSETGTILRIDVGRLDAIAAALVQKRQAERQPFGGQMRGPDGVQAVAAPVGAVGSGSEGASDLGREPEVVHDTQGHGGLFARLSGRIKRWLHPGE